MVNIYFTGEWRLSNVSTSSSTDQTRMLTNFQIYADQHLTEPEYLAILYIHFLVYINKLNKMISNLLI